MNPAAPRVAIVDYRMGNLFSVLHACEAVGLAASVTSDPAEVLAADAAILPGVGAFGDAMANLRALGLDAACREVIAAGRPFLGICLGMQLLFAESEEFGCHRGLGLIPGRVVKFPPSAPSGRRLKVPQIGWNQIRPARDREASRSAAVAGNARGVASDHGPAGPPTAPDAAPEWADTPLAGLPSGTYMYFVHSFYGVPDRSEQRLTVTDYDGFSYCSAVRDRNLVAFQFHPEKSAELGIRIYRNWAAAIPRPASL